jgi:hypothetical protein
METIINQGNNGRTKEGIGTDWLNWKGPSMMMPQKMHLGRKKLSFVIPTTPYGRRPHGGQVVHFRPTNGRFYS